MTTVLFDPARHEPLAGEPWSRHRTEAAIREILADIVEQQQAPGVWLPNEEWKWPATCIYLGATGTLWALNALREFAPPSLDTASLARSLYDSYFEAEHVELASSRVGDALPSWFLGESGVLTVLGQMDESLFAETTDRLYDIVQRNRENPTLEPLWGGSGSILAALFAMENDLGERWRLPLIEHGEFFRQALIEDEATGTLIWEQDLYGERMRYLGAGHGFAGNLYPFCRGGNLLPRALREWARSVAHATLMKTASIEDDCATWPSAIGWDRTLVQWCHGAPGIIISLNDIPRGWSRDFDELMTMAGNTIWRAGPLTKGVGLCHGTDGNGYALLKLFSRTGDELWLDRARQFAMHALGQRTRSPSLWVGDAGLACFLRACMEGDDRMPLLDRV